MLTAKLFITLASVSVSLTFLTLTPCSTGLFQHGNVEDNWSIVSVTVLLEPQARVDGA